MKNSRTKSKFFYFCLTRFPCWVFEREKLYDVYAVSTKFIFFERTVSTKLCFTISHLFIISFFFIIKIWLERRQKLINQFQSLDLKEKTTCTNCTDYFLYFFLIILLVVRINVCLCFCFFFEEFTCVFVNISWMTHCKKKLYSNWCFWILIIFYAITTHFEFDRRIIIMLNKLQLNWIQCQIVVGHWFLCTYTPKKLQYVFPINSLYIFWYRYTPGSSLFAWT